MFDLNKIVRRNILELEAYSSARSEYVGDADVFLDANENPFGKWNRYPDPYQQKLKKQISKIKQVDTSNIFLGNGSDEIIDLLFRIFCKPGKDKALTFSPTYGMYDVSAGINDVELIKVPLNNIFELNYNNVLTYLSDPLLKLIFICSPNNPTGNSFSKKTIEKICADFNGIVVIDEAYIDFSTEQSLVELLNENGNLVVIQTLSKAWGLAAVRVGMAFCSTSIIQLLNKVKPPYNISATNQEVALNALQDISTFEKNIALILSEKEKLREKLRQLDTVEKVFPSDTNFFLIKVKNANRTYRQLVEKKIIVRNRNTLVKNCIRITVGTNTENNKLIKALQELENKS
ncbi:MAG: histidinol-phosphate transaminase [Saprospiraceae bacterium]